MAVGVDETGDQGTLEKDLFLRRVTLSRRRDSAVGIIFNETVPHWSQTVQGVKVLSS